MSEKNIITGTGREDVHKVIDEYLKKIKFGSITLVIQDGRVVQIESSEKIRINKN